MRLSEKRKDALYNAVKEPIMKLRLKIEKGEVRDVDYQLFKLERDIWDDMMVVLLKPVREGK